MPYILEIILLVIGGFVAGSYGSVVGGGSLASFPVLILLGVPVDVAIGTNRFSVVFLMISSVWAYTKKKLIEWKYATTMALAAMPAGVLGAQIVADGSESLINIIVAVALVVLMVLLPRIKHIKPVARNKVSDIEIFSVRYFALLMGSALLGVYGGFYGAGFGTFIIFLYVFLSGKSLLQGAANTSVVGFAMSSAASIFFISEGLVVYSKATPLIVGSVIGAQVGVRYAFKADSKWIKYALVAVIVLSAGKLVIEAL